MVKQNRWIVVHPKKGVYLGNGWWSKSPEAEAVNHVPTFTSQELADGCGLKDADGNPTGGYGVLVGHEHIDMLDNYVSMDTIRRRLGYAKAGTANPDFRFATPAA